jgi:hypothetical protein
LLLWRWAAYLFARRAEEQPMATPTLTDRPTAIEEPDDEHPMLVLTIRCAPEDVSTVRAILAVVRSGLASSAFNSEPDLAWAHFGPSVLSPLDAKIMEAFHDDWEPFDDGSVSEKEPSIIAGRGVRAAARFAAAQAFRMPLPPAPVGRGVSA